jgi:NAD(P)-dependent dehydrogenase (short-subunit alcohol dehydrogenase family)
MTLSLQGQVAFITGGGSGLGAAAARRLAADGVIVAINDLSMEAAKKVADELGGLAFAFDVTDSAAFQSAVDTCVAQLGRLDIMINNAGIAWWRTWGKEWRETSLIWNRPIISSTSAMKTGTA